MKGKTKINFGQIALEIISTPEWVGSGYYYKDGWRRDNEGPWISRWMTQGPQRRGGTETYEHCDVDEFIDDYCHTRHYAIYADGRKRKKVMAQMQKLSAILRD